MKLLTSIVLTFLATIAIVWLGFVFTARAGAIDVASTAEYVPGAEWFFSTLTEESIRRHAEEAVDAGEIAPPTDVTAEVLRIGASHYDAMCVVCHGGPGLERGELGQGLKPQPPDLSHTAREMNEAEILWVLHHGIRHTGMPAFGNTHSAQELEAVTALVARFDGMSPEEYERLAGTTASGAGGRHDHGDHGAGEGSMASAQSAHGHDQRAAHGHDEGAHGHDEASAHGHDEASAHGHESAEP